MRRHRKKLALIMAAAATAVCAILAVFSGKPEPSLSGRPLSQWIQRYNSHPFSGFAEQTDDEAADAIRHIGTNGIPWLLAWLSYETPQWRRKLESTAADLASHIGDAPLRITYALTQDEKKRLRADQAAYAFSALGPTAKPAAPALVRITRLGSVENGLGPDDRARLALGYIGLPAIPAIADELSNPSHGCNFRLSWCLQDLGTNATGPLVPVLLLNLNYTNELATSSAIVTLGQLGLDRAVVVPAITRSLTDARAPVRQTAAFWLGKLGDAAASALPALTNALNDPDIRVASAALAAIHTLARDTQTNAPPPTP